jgi:hypothetical protein
MTDEASSEFIKVVKSALDENPRKDFTKSILLPLAENFLIMLRAKKEEPVTLIPSGRGMT